MRPTMTGICQPAVVASQPAPPASHASLVIEKILTGLERLPKEWPVCGTTGYDFSNLVNGLYVDPAAVARFDSLYRSFTGVEASYDDLAYRCRKLIVRYAGQRIKCAGESVNADRSLQTKHLRLYAEQFARRVDGSSCQLSRVSHFDDCRRKLRE